MSISRKYYSILVVLTAVYVALAFLLPPDPASLDKYHVTAAQLRVLLLPLVVFIVAIWAVSNYGFVEIIKYIELIKNSPESKWFGLFATGLGVYAIGMPLSSILDSILTYVSSVRADFIPTSVVINNYASIVIAATVFTLFRVGTKRLADSSGIKIGGAMRIAGWVSFAALGAVYAYIALNNPIRQFAASPLERPTYGLPDHLIVATIIIPYLYIWYSGFLSAFYMYKYGGTAQGIIYKKSLSTLSLGLLVIMLTSILLQFLATFSAILNAVDLNTILGIIYVLLVVIAIGFIFVAIGARRLSRIEKA